jgi:hypothetical protein
MKRNLRWWALVVADLLAVAAVVLFIAHICGLL